MHGIHTWCAHWVQREKVIKIDVQREKMIKIDVQREKVKKFDVQREKVKKKLTYKGKK